MDETYKQLPSMDKIIAKILFIQLYMNTIYEKSAITYLMERRYMLLMSRRICNFTLLVPQF